MFAEEAAESAGVQVTNQTALPVGWQLDCLYATHAEGYVWTKNTQNLCDFVMLRKLTDH